MEHADGIVPLAWDDAALGQGLAVFETLRTYRRLPFRVDVHLDRLAASAAWCGIPVNVRVVGAEIYAAAARIDDESRINVILTAQGRRVVRAEVLDRGRVGAPVRVATREWEPPPWLPGRVKHTSRAAWVLAARQAGTDEVLWLDRAGCWTEANRSNVFAVRGGALLTPPDDGRILQGITRDTVIAVARAAGVEVREEPLPARRYDELYLCSTLKELAPVIEIDGEPGPGGGPVGTRVRAAFEAFTGEPSA